jgi:hypothetical protein
MLKRFGHSFLQIGRIFHANPEHARRAGQRDKVWIHQLGWACEAQDTSELRRGEGPILDTTWRSDPFFALRRGEGAACSREIDALAGPVKRRSAPNLRARMQRGRDISVQIGLDTSVQMSSDDSITRWISGDRLVIVSCSASRKSPLTKHRKDDYTEIYTSVVCRCGHIDLIVRRQFCRREDFSDRV